MATSPTRKLHDLLAAATPETDDFSLGVDCANLIRNEGARTTELIHGYTALDWAVSKRKLKTLSILSDMLVEQCHSDITTALGTLNNAIDVARNLDFHMGMRTLNGCAIKLREELERIRKSPKFGKGPTFN